MMKNAIVAQSGGPTTAINASLAGVIKGCLESNEIDVLYGARNGAEGDSIYVPGFLQKKTEGYQPGF